MDGYISSSSPLLDIKYEPMGTVAVPCADAEEKTTPWDLLESGGSWLRLLGVYAIVGVGMAQGFYRVSGKAVLTRSFLSMVSHDAVRLLAPLFFLWIVALIFLPIVPEIMLLLFVWSFKSIVGVVSRLDGWLFDGSCWALRKALGFRSEYVLGGLAFLCEAGVLIACVCLARRLMHGFITRW